MKTPIITSTCALIIGLYGITPALAESFNDQGLDWAMASPTPTFAYPIQQQTPPSNGSFANSWNKEGQTPSQYEGSSSSLTHLDTGQSCNLAPRIGFNQRNNFPTC